VIHLFVFLQFFCISTPGRSLSRNDFEHVVYTQCH